MASNIKIRFKMEYQVSNPTVVEDVLRQRPGWKECSLDDTNWDLFWCNLSTVKTLFESNLKSQQRIAHFRGFYEFSRKNSLAKNLKRYKRQCIRNGNNEEADLCDAMPETYEIPSETSLFLAEAKRHPRTLWIAKPSGSSRGKGIFLFKKIKEFEDWMKNKDWTPKEVQRSNEPTDIGLVPEIWIVQKYISNPYLLQGRKFDIRMYVLVMSFSPLTVWIARDGFARISGLDYSKKNLSDKCMHLTNSSIQLSERNSTQGRKWDIQNLRIFLTAMHGREPINELFQNIAKVVITTLKCVDSHLMGSKNCFELFGFDILLKDDLSVCLLEVNAAPSMSATDEHDYQLKYNLIQDVLNVLDLENNFTGKEIRIGGLDKVWCDGPIYQISKGMDSPEFCKTNNLYNMYLGCVNDRDAQLQAMNKWMDILKKQDCL